MASLKQSLINIGLSEKEAAVYLALLERGPSTVLQISAHANINRPTTYLQIESLKHKGLVSTQQKDTKQLFIAESPELLFMNLEKEKKEIDDKKSELTKMLPELKTLLNLGPDKPIVRYFEGSEGLLKMQEEFLKCKEKLIYGFFSIDAVENVLPDIGKNYTPRRVQKKIKTRSIYTSIKGPVFKREDKKLLRQTKFIKPEKFPFTSDVTIFDNKVAITSLKGKITGTIIEHKEIANSFRVLFELLWDLIK